MLVTLAQLAASRPLSAPVLDILRAPCVRSLNVAQRIDPARLYRRLRRMLCIRRKGGGNQPNRHCSWVFRHADLLRAVIFAFVILGVLVVLKYRPTMSLKEAAQLVALGAVSSISSFTHYLAIDMLSVSAAIAIQLQLIQPSGLWRWHLSNRRQSEIARRSRHRPSLHPRHLRHVPLVV